MTAAALNPLLAEILEAHGGLDRWRSYEGLSSTIVSGGDLWGLKGIDMPPIPRVATTTFRRQWMSVTPFGEPDWTMTWTPDHVSIESGAGDIIAERDDPRKAFAGHGYDTPWDPLHLAYFNGYAMWTYHALPFVLAEPGYEVIEIASIEHDGQTLRGLGVRFPDDTHTHTREQRLYFGDDRLLCRHDYEVDVWAGTAAAHFISDYVTVDGFCFPTKRRVHPRAPDGSFDRRISIVTVDMSNYMLRRNLRQSFNQRKDTSVTKPEKVIYTAKTHTTGGRDGASRSSDGRLEVKLSTPGTSGTGTNPEQLFAAGWSACFEGAMGLAARSMKVVLPAEAAIDAEVDLAMTGDAYLLQARLNVRLPGLDRETAQAIVDKAHQTCPYSKATRGNIDVVIKLVETQAKAAELVDV